MAQYLADMYDAVGSQKQYDAFGRANTLAGGMPGYAQLGEQYDKINADVAPDYMDRWAAEGMNPLDFIQGLPGFGAGEDGSYGPIGADQLVEHGEGMYELFDKFVPGMEYIAENQGVSDAQLANMLGESSAGFQANMANQNAQAERNMGRMGIDPSSGAYAAGAGSRAMQGAAGLSGLQQNVRQDASQQDWQQRMEAAGIGLQAGQQGTDALSQATGAYGDAYNMFGGVYGDYMGGLAQMGGLTEDARQFNYTQAGDLAQGLTGARPAFDQTFYGSYMPRQVASSTGSPGQLATIGAPAGVNEAAVYGAGVKQ